MKSKTVCFTGHRIIKKELKNLIINLISKGVIYYGVGGAIGFDTIAALTILS